jgi:hypothetical protein
LDRIENNNFFIHLQENLQNSWFHGLSVRGMEDIQLLASCSVQAIRNGCLDRILGDNQSLSEWLVQAKELDIRQRLRSLAGPQHHLYDHLISVIGSVDDAGFCAERTTSLGLNSKKLHEVPRLSEVVTTMCRLSSSDRVLDLGCGKSYLTTTLAFAKDLSVLGVDRDPIQIAGSRHRIREIIKQQKKADSAKQSMESRITLLEEHVDSASLGRILTNYTDTDMPVRWCMTGLHACGPLSVSGIGIILLLIVLGFTFRSIQCIGIDIRYNTIYWTIVILYCLR